MSEFRVCFPGCPCETCERQRRLNRRNRKLRVLGKPTMVDPRPAVEHIERLVAQGFLNEYIACAAGLQASTISETRRGVAKKIKRSTLDAILSVTPEADVFTRPAIGSIRRVRALVALGWTFLEIERRAGLSPQYLRHMCSSGYRVETTITEAIDRAYREMSMSLGPSGRQRSFAANRGWAPPLAWEGIDMDDPAARPEIGSPARPKDSLDEVVVERVMRGERLPMTRAERVAVVSKMRAQGHGLTEIEARTGIKKPYRYAGSDGLVA